MHRSFNRPLLSASLVTLAVVVAGTFAAAASLAQPAGTAEQRLSALESQVAALTQDARAGQVAGVTVAIQVADGAGLHGMEEALKAGGLKAGYLGTVRRTRLVVASTAWPADLQAAARGLTGDLESLQLALELEDVAAAVEAATAAHASEHAFSTAVYAWLARAGGTTPNLRATTGGH